MVSELKKNWKETLPPDMVEAYRAAAIARKNNTDLITGASVNRTLMAGAPKPKYNDFGAPQGGIGGGLGGALPPAGGAGFGGADFGGTEVAPLAAPPPPARFERPEQVWDTLDPAARGKYAPLVGQLRGLSEQKEAMLQAKPPAGEGSYDKKIRESKVRESLSAIDKEIRTTREKLEASLSPEFKSARFEVAKNFMVAIKELSKKAKGRTPEEAKRYLDAQRTIRNSFRGSFGIDINRVIE
jgi:hypothetical protein